MTGCLPSKNARAVRGRVLRGRRSSFDKQSKAASRIQRKESATAAPSMLYSFSDMAHHFRVSHWEIAERLRRGDCELIDIGPGGSRHAWRVSRRSGEKFIAARRVNRRPAGKFPHV